MTGMEQNSLTSWTNNLPARRQIYPLDGPTIKLKLKLKSKIIWLLKMHVCLTLQWEIETPGQTRANLIALMGLATNIIEVHGSMLCSCVCIWFSNSQRQPFNTFESQIRGYKSESNKKMRIVQQIPCSRSHSKYQSSFTDSQKLFFKCS